MHQNTFLVNFIPYSKHTLQDIFELPININLNCLALTSAHGRVLSLCLCSQTLMICVPENLIKEKKKYEKRLW